MITKQATVVRTTVEYSAVSTLHGLQYIFESGKNLSISKVLWLLVVLGATGFGIIWSYEGGSISSYLYTMMIIYEFLLSMKELGRNWTENLIS